MITQRTVLDRIEIVRHGAIQVRLALELFQDGVLLHTQFHRTAIDKDGNVAEQMGYVNAHLLEMGKSPVNQEDINRIQAHQNVVRNPIA